MLDEQQRIRERERLEFKKSKEVEEGWALLITNLNVMGTNTGDLIADAVLREHPTLAGQFAKAVAVGIIRACVRDDDYGRTHWQTDGAPVCHEKLTRHPMHDGRWSCELVVGALHMVRQPLI